MKEFSLISVFSILSTCGCFPAQRVSIPSATATQPAVDIPVQQTAAAVPAFNRNSRIIFIGGWNGLMRTFGAAKAVKGKIPVAFFSRFDEKELDEVDMLEITLTARIAELRRDIWFIGVHHNRGNGNYLVRIYFAPDEERGRLRQGKYLVIRGARMANAIAAAKEELLGSPISRAIDAISGRDRAAILFDYTQITERATNDVAEVPAGIDVPFPTPHDFTSDEIEQIVNFARTDASGPILRIERRDGDVVVRTGTQEGGLSGTGELLRYRKLNGKWFLISIGHWVS